MIFRDDDISCFTNVDDFKRVHELFNKYNVTHTIAVIAKDIDKNSELIEYILSQSNINVQLHCWDHVDMTQLNEIELQWAFSKGVSCLKTWLKKNPTILYPPWNKHSTPMDEKAKMFDMTVSSKKISLAQYIKFGGDVGEETINFHYWAPQETMLLEQALIIFTQRNQRCI